MKAKPVVAFAEDYLSFGRRLERFDDVSARLFVAANTEILLPFFEQYLARNPGLEEAEGLVVEAIQCLWESPRTAGPRRLREELRDQRPLLEENSPLEQVTWGYQEIELLVLALSTGPVAPVAGQAFVQVRGTFLELARAAVTGTKALQRPAVFPPFAALLDFEVMLAAWLEGDRPDVALLRLRCRELSSDLFSGVERYLPERRRPGPRIGLNPLTGERIEIPPR